MSRKVTDLLIDLQVGNKYYALSLHKRKVPVSKVNRTTEDICIATYSESLLRCSAWHVFNGITLFYLPPTSLSTSGMNHTYLYSLPSCRASLHFSGQYSFPVPLRVGG